MKTRNRILSIFLVIAMVFAIMPTVFAAKTQAQTQTQMQTVYFTAPVIFANTGDIIDLSCYNVMFDNSNVTSASRITWTSGTATVTDGKVAASAKGVYTLTAKASNLTKTVYVVVKAPTDTEYVLYEKDFSTVASWDALVEEGYALPETVSSHVIEVADGKLKLTGKPHKNISQVILPWWLSEFGDYTIESDIDFTGRESASRFYAITFNHQSNTSTGLYPYSFFKASDPTANDGKTAVGLDCRTAQWSWLGSVDGSYGADTYQKGAKTYKVEKYGSHVNGYLAGSKVVDTEYQIQHELGGIGFLVRGASIEISNVKVTLDKAKIDALYNNLNNVVTDANPAILANAGETVNLKDYSVYFSSTALMAADKITWSSTDLTVTDGKVRPAEAGVYKLSAVPTVHPKNSSKVNIGTLNETVYLVVKNPNDKEYVLFDIDYSDYTSMDQLTEMGYVIAEQPTGFTVGVEDGALAIKGDSTNTKNINARVLLPEWLSEFGNYSIESDIKFTKTTNANRYFAFMYRVQNESNYYPLFTTTFRGNGNNDAGYAPGLNSGNTPDWKTGVTGTGVGALNGGVTHNFKATVVNDNIKTYIDGKNIINADFIGKYSNNYNKGYLGYFVRGVDIAIASTKVVLEVGNPEIPLVKTENFESDVILPATVIEYVDSLSDIQTADSAVAVMRVDASLNVVDANGEAVTTAAAALELIKDNTIPAFYVRDAAQKDAAVSFIIENGLYDAFVISDVAELVKAATDACYSIRGVVDFSGESITEDELYSIRKITNEASARICILPESLATKKNVEYLQRLFMAVWVKSDDTKVGNVSAIVTGASGIITEDPTKLIGAFTTYFDENTMTRTVGIIGHQGNYVQGQPNTVAGSMGAYNFGVTAIETDIHLTKDGVIVCMHDDTLDRASTGTGKITNYTYEELRAFEVDQHGGAEHEPIATLADYFDAFKGMDVQLIVEVKGAGTTICQSLADLIKEYGMQDQVNAIFFDVSQLETFKTAMPEISAGLLCNSLTANEKDPLSTVYSILEFTQTYDSTYNPQYATGTLGEGIFKAALDRGVNIYPYTIDNSADMSRFFLYGAHAITTNYSHNITNMVKALTTDKAEYEATGKETEITVTAESYGRVKTPVTDAKLVFVEGDDVFTYEDGKIISSEAGSATLMFSYECKTLNGEVYNVVTEPFTFNCDSLDWNFDEETGTLTVYKNLGDFTAKNTPWAEYANDVKKLVVADGVTEIGNWAFGYFYNLTEVVLPETLTSIGTNAFYRAQKLEKLEIPESVNTIKSGAFSYCYALKEINIPVAVTTIESYTFFDCEKLTAANYAGTELQWNSILIKKGNENLTNAYPPVVEEKFEWKVENGTLIISGNTFMPDYTAKTAPWFAQVDEIKAIVIEDGIKSIGKYAFSYLDKATTVEIADTVTKIAPYAFYGAGLKEVTIPDSVKELGNGAFTYCRSLAKVEIPAGIKKVQNYTFFGCNKLETALYAGDWNNLTINTGNDPLVNANKEEDTTPKAQVNTLGTLTVPVAGENYTLDTAYAFVATEKFEDVNANSEYKYYHADFVVSFDKDIKDIALAGYYDEYANAVNSKNWVPMILENKTAGEQTRLLKDMWFGEDGSISYQELCLIEEFLCGALDLNDDDAGVTMTVELRLYEVTENAPETNVETGAYVTCGSYTYTF